MTLSRDAMADTDSWIWSMVTFARQIELTPKL
jgi:hypothetical protein